MPWVGRGGRWPQVGLSSGEEVAEAPESKSRLGQVLSVRRDPTPGVGEASEGSCLRCLEAAVPASSPLSFSETFL